MTAIRGARRAAPWTRQIETIEIASEDAISDRGEEVYNLLEERGIHNIIVTGVHTNMCVLGRPFSIRQLTRVGKNVVLMRDLTDTMYSSRSRPYVSHFRGTDLVVEHIERYWCPTVVSTDLTGKPAFRFSADERPRIAFVIGEDEYDAARTLPAFAGRELVRRFGFECTFTTSASPASIEGLETLAEADLAVVFARRRTLPEDQLALVRAYVDSGRPIVGIRTASHAFQNWLEFDPLVLGGNYHGHHGNKGVTGPATFVRAAPDAAAHPVMHGVTPAEFRVASWLYEVEPLAATCTTLMTGRVAGREPEQPVAWVNEAGGRRVFYTSLGHPRDFELAAFRRLLVNGIFWALELEPPWMPPSAAALVTTEAPGWHLVRVPGTWEQAGIAELAEYDGVAWYRCRLRLPEHWTDRDLTLEFANLDNCDETFFNGELVGRGGGFPPTFVNAAAMSRSYTIPARMLRPGADNLIAFRVYDEGGAGGFKAAAPILSRGEEQLDLAGAWLVRAGDDPGWSR